MVRSSFLGSPSLEILNARIRVKDALLFFLIGSVLLNLFLVSQLHSLDANGSHSLHASSDEHPFSPQKSTSKLLNEVKSKQQSEERKPSKGKVLLQCESFGGPSDEAAADMVYWRNDIPLKKQFHSVYGSGKDKYFVFQPDEAGFSNVRLTFETVLALVKATGRTLVLIPTMRFAQLTYEHPEGLRSYAFTDFFDISNIPTISMEEYLNRVAMTGQLHDGNGTVTFPPNNRTNFDGSLGNTVPSIPGEAPALFMWLSEAMMAIDWKRDDCVIAFPAEKDKGIESIRSEVAAILEHDTDGPEKRISSYRRKPVPVSSDMGVRLREMLAERKQLCEYNKTYQAAGSIYMSGLESTGIRPLIQFFAYLFFENWRQDLQMKRFLRDHLRFSDVIQCAAARMVAAIRDVARISGGNDNGNGGFDTMHIRRGDFTGINVYKDGVEDPNKLASVHFFESRRTVYIATDEQDKSVFDPLRQNNTVLFLNDLMHLLEDIDPNFYGMIEQLVCAKGDKFVGTYYSTFTAYINRLRGYHAQKTRSPEAMKGSINSEYMGHEGKYRYISSVSEGLTRCLVFVFLSFCSFLLPLDVHECPESLLGSGMAHSLERYRL
jgi:GDP-fucose protein O-fucosyltransferase